jgi:hypothetical protein
MDALLGFSLLNVIKNVRERNVVVAFSIMLPQLAMDRFASEVEKLLTPLVITSHRYQQR